MPFFEPFQPVVEAVQWDGTPAAALNIRRMGADFRTPAGELLTGLEGATSWQVVPTGGWIIRGSGPGHFWWVSNDDFVASYQAIPPGRPRKLPPG